MACNSAMSPNETSALIEAVGGDSAFAKLIGIDNDPGFAQRVNNWKRRGIPAPVELEHYETLKKLRAKIASGARSN